MSASRGRTPTAHATPGVAAGLATCETAFAVLDEVVQVRDEHGIVTVLLGQEAVAALGRHLVRRAHCAGREVVVAGLTGSGEPWRELGRRLGAFGTSEPSALARRIATVATGKLLVVGERETSCWGQAVTDEIARLSLDSSLRILVVVLHATAPEATHASLVPVQPAHVAIPDAGAAPRQIVLELARLTEADSRRWWEATIAEGDLLRGGSFDRLDALDSWWQTARTLGAGQPPVLPPVSAEGEALHVLALRAEEPLTGAQLTSLASADVREELVAAGLLQLEPDGLYHPAGRALDERPLPAEANARLARVLVDPSLLDSEEPDAWSLMRASELSAAAGDMPRAEELALTAVGLVSHASAREDIWRRWSSLVDGAAGEGDSAAEQVGRLSRAAARALALSDGERADGFARRAMGLDGGRFDVLVLRGRASTSRADLTTAALVLERALTVARTDDERAEATGALAEVDYHAGRHELAARRAESAASESSRAAVRLDARNTLGKLLLGQARWAEADVHFAQDAVDAADAHDVERELRARLNRAIALLSLGRREDARGMFHEVLGEGEARGSMRAVAFALSNLAAMAIADLSYERALALSERAIDVRHRLGERTGLVRPITNLAELRLRLGLVDEAEQALRFGLQACGTKLPSSLLAYFALVSARIHLARGETNEAWRHVGRARSGAAGSGDGGMVGECERLAVRIALEDGDVRRASATLLVAREKTPTPDRCAELELLEAACRRAVGESFAEPARKALGIAEQRGDAEQAREAHVMLSLAARLDGDDAASCRHLAAAVAERDRIAQSLPEGLRRRYLSRPDLGELGELESERTAAPAASANGGLPALEAGSCAPERDRRVMIGDCASMRALRSAIDRIAPTDTTVLVQGETGTGKELVAEAIHRGSKRRDGPLVKVNCAALVETLLLSELFGHERGAFTGASSRRRGRFELADGGTLFLDEIGDISPRTQVALLRVLQDGTFERVGGTTTHKANVRVICATHRDLRAMVERGEFREDLYYRLCGVTLEVPALRERTSDLPALARALLEQAERSAGLEPKTIAPDALAALGRHGWPGNVRELENALRVASLFARGPEIRLLDFTSNVEGLRHLADAEPSTVRAAQDAAPAARADATRASEPEGAITAGADSSDLAYAEIRSGTSLADLKHRLERECIARALSDAGGNITHAAALLGMKRPRLSQLVKQYQLGSAQEEKSS